MPFNGAGGFTRVMDWTNDAAAAIKIRADRHDQEDDNLAAGLSNCICKDGQTTVTANIPFNGKRLINVADPTNPQDAATKHWCEDTIRVFSLGTRLTGVTAAGISKAVHGFTEADMSIVARVAGTPAGSKNRIAINSAADGTGTDLFVINDDGQLSGVSYFIDRFYTANTTWTKPTIAAQGIVPKYVEAIVVGGGGGGGGANSSAGNVMVGSGGGGGAAARKLYDASALGATVSITIGAGGAGGTGTVGANGGDGGATSFGSLTANGGIGGGNTANDAVAGARVGGAGSTTAAGHDEMWQGSPGQPGIKFASPGFVAVGGAGGASGAGNGGSRAAGSPGVAGVVGDRGGGGNGGYSANATGGSGGGGGGPGYVKVREYY